MLKPKMQDELNAQINKEYHSSYVYLSMSAWFEGKNLSGMSSWMRHQSNEELVHAMKIFDYVYERGGDVTLEAIAKPEIAWATPLEVFEAAYQHECYISRSIDDLVNTAAAEKDHATHNMLQWFISEQVEEEATASAIVEKLRMAQDAPGALYMIDRELSQRAPAAAGHGH